MNKINDIFACKALFFIMAFSIGLWTISIPTIRDQIQTDYLGIGYIMLTFAVGSIIAMLCANFIIIRASSKKILQKIGLGRVALENSGNIGKSYRRHDEIGTPICITVDFETLENSSVTVRDRDTMLQKRLFPEDLINYYKNYFK